MKLYIRTGSVLLGKGQQVFKIRPVNLKLKSPRTSLKRIPVGVRYGNRPKFVFVATKNLNKTAILIATRHEKINLPVT